MNKEREALYVTEPLFSYYQVIIVPYAALEAFEVTFLCADR